MLVFLTVILFYHTELYPITFPISRNTTGGKMIFVSSWSSFSFSIYVPCHCSPYFSSSFSFSCSPLPPLPCCSVVKPLIVTFLPGYHIQGQCSYIPKVGKNVCGQQRILPERLIVYMQNGSIIGRYLSMSKLHLPTENKGASTQHSSDLEKASYDKWKSHTYHKPCPGFLFHGHAR